MWIEPVRASGMRWYTPTMHRPSCPSSRRVRIHRGVACLLSLLFVASAAAARDDDQAAYVEYAGEWGVLQAYDVLIAAPEAVLDMVPQPSAQTVWSFSGMAADDVAKLVDQPGLPPDVSKELLDRGRWRLVDGRVQLTPSPQALLAIPPEARAAIYEVLAKYPENEFQVDPYYIPKDDVRWWLADSGIRQDLIETIEKTAYPIGRAAAFSDLSLLLSMTASRAEGRMVMKALSRSAASILRLRLDGASDLRKIGEYWSAGSANAKDFMPLLESTATNPQIRHLDLVHILPPYARKLIYTYPHVSHAVGGRYPDCHWTCLNFFNYRPEQRLIDTPGANMFVNEQYESVAGGYRYGDVLFMTTAAGEAIHSCVYLAAGFVFTKNGANVMSPWVIMRLDDVKERYSRHGDVEVSIYRRSH